MASQTAAKSAPSFTSRAVTRAIEAGSQAECAHCGDRVKFQARVRANQVICNVYIDGRWNRVEHYHEPCYTEVDEPYGPAASPPRPAEFPPRPSVPPPPERLTGGLACPAACSRQAALAAVYQLQRRSRTRASPSSTTEPRAPGA